MTLLGLLLIGAGMVVIATHWDEFIASSHLIFSPHNWLSMALAWVVLKIVHELGHALVCKRHGGEVREAGLIFILLAPAAFVDVTSSWRFASKWQRIHVAAAGMYVELVLAALAAMVWSQADSVVLRHLLFNMIVMASFSTLVFNANPLMRFDGYYIFADLLEIPNLATEGVRFVRQLGAYVFYGRMLPSRELLGGRGWVVRIYGLAAWLWRLVVCVSLLAAASVLFKGAGLVLGVAGAACWFGKPLVQTAGELYRHYHESPLVAAASRHRGGGPGGCSLRHAGLAALAGDGHRAGRRRVYRSVHRAQRCCRVHRPDPCFRRAAGRSGRPPAGTAQRRAADGIPRTPISPVPGRRVASRGVGRTRRRTGAGGAAQSAGARRAVR